MQKEIESTEAKQTYFGKYRAKVLDNNDPMNIGRIKVVAPAVSNDALSWAMPCVPYAGQNVGFYAIPPINASVWVEFEGGDPSFPIWVGGFWNTAAEKPAAGPSKKVWQTEKMSLSLDDEQVALSATVKTENGTFSISINTNGITISANKSTLTVKPNDLSLNNGPATVTVSNSITLKNGAASADIQTSAINLINGAASIAMNPAVVNINNGALEVM